MQSKNILSRRSFLKLASLIPFTWFAKPLTQLAGQNNMPNVIVLVFDSWSANHVQFYGYPRQTMPNLERFAENAAVFHQHYSAGTFTVPGTGSLLTGLHPWTHRALGLTSAGITQSQTDHQIFSVFSDTHSTLGYSQNKYVDLFLYQSEKFLNVHIKSGAFDLEHKYIYNQPLLDHDAGTAYTSFDDNILRPGTGYSSSLFIDPIYRLLKLHERQVNTVRFETEYPRGLPDSTEQFLLGDVVDGAIHALHELHEPSLVYFHFYPPHGPYNPERKFYKAFREDDWQPESKPVHRLSVDQYSYETSRDENQNYDEYLLNWDNEINRLFQYLRDSGLLDRSYFILTSDHGELFERGEIGHFTPIIFEPLIHIPLIISSPGQKGRKDIFTPTSAVDILPTLAHLIGEPVPAWAEGQLLPSFGGVEDPTRSIFCMDAKNNSPLTALTKTTVSLTKNNYRLTYYGYLEDKQFEFYDLSEDPDELRDLFPSKPSVVQMMRDELLQKLADVNRPFQD